MLKKKEETIFKEIDQYKKTLLAAKAVRVTIGALLILLFSISLYKGLYKGVGEVLSSSPFMLVGFIFFILGFILAYFFIKKFKKDFKKGIEPPKKDKIQYLRYWEAYYKNNLKALKYTVWWHFLLPAPGLVLMMIGANLYEPLGLKSIVILIFKFLFVVVTSAGLYYLGSSYEAKRLQAGMDDVSGLISESKTTPIGRGLRRAPRRGLRTCVVFS